ncbi:MAG: TetR/AcrR family transcriptional regulator [Myxococcota bacterium]
MEGALDPRRATTAVARNDQRRARIVQALRECMLARGYAGTSLSDIARAAGMTPSHLLYYFKGKDAIVNAYWQTLAEDLLTRLRAIEHEPLERRIDLLTEVMLSDETASWPDLGLFLELCGLAVHQKDLYQTKARFDHEFKSWLAQQLDEAPRKLGPYTAMAAESTYALLMGLCTSAYFDERLGYERARAILRLTLRQLAGYEPLLGTVA